MSLPVSFLHRLTPLLAGALAVLGGGPSGPQEADVQRPEFAAGAATEVRWFRLEHEGTEAEARDIPVGLLRWVSRRGPTPGELQVQLEWTLFEPATRILHVESLEGGERRLTWRERRARTGRTLTLTGDSRVGFRSVETTGRELHRRELSSRGKLPLSVLEAFRRGLPLPGETPWFEPLSGTFEPRFLRVERLPSEGRVLRVLDPQGRTVARHRFQGEEPLELRFSAEGPRAMPVDRATYDQLLRAYHERLRLEADEED